MYSKSPLNYIGGKYKMLPKLLPLFPARINTFYDLFAGGVWYEMLIHERGE